jgi:hypothetical protein
VDEAWATPVTSRSEGSIGQCIGRSGEGDGGHSSTLGRTGLEAVVQWRVWPGIVVEVTGAHGDGSTGVGGAAALLSMSLYPRTLASSGTVSAAARSTKNRVKESLQVRG